MANDTPWLAQEIICSQPWNCEREKEQVERRAWRCFGLTREEGLADGFDEDEDEDRERIALILNIYEAKSLKVVKNEKDVAHPPVLSQP